MITFMFMFKKGKLSRHKADQWFAQDWGLTANKGTVLDDIIALRLYCDVG